jgi:hypothetical protein
VGITGTTLLEERVPQSWTHTEGQMTGGGHVLVDDCHLLHQVLEVTEGGDPDLQLCACIWGVCWGGGEDSCTVASAMLGWVSGVITRRLSLLSHTQGLDQVGRCLPEPPPTHPPTVSGQRRCRKRTALRRCSSSWWAGNQKHNTASGSKHERTATSSAPAPIHPLTHMSPDHIPHHRQQQQAVLIDNKPAGAMQSRP